MRQKRSARNSLTFHFCSTKVLSSDPTSSSRQYFLDFGEVRRFAKHFALPNDAGLIACSMEGSSSIEDADFVGFTPRHRRSRMGTDDQEHAT